MIFDDQPASRQDLYDRIRASSLDSVVLEEMIRSGFWAPEGVLPEDPADEIRRRAELQQELGSLRREHAGLKDEAALLRKIRRERLKASREKQKETKARRAHERAARAEAWKERRAKDVVYLGAGVSGGLNEKEGDSERLEAAGLPVAQDAPSLAQALGISVGELRFLTFSRAVSRVTHYQTFALPKRSGGTRLIRAPRPRLKAAQRWVLTEILDRVPLHEAAHGFRQGRSVVSNAEPHVGQAIVVNLDLADFFPTVRYPRVKGMFRWLGYSEAAATLLGLLCTAAETAEVELDGVTYHVAEDPVRRLPQGAPSSPGITNVLCQRLDRRLTKVAGDLGFRYTRYADDLSFSNPDPGADVGRLLRRVRWVVERDGFQVHPRKTRVLRRSGRQEVTGIVVNERPAIARETLKRFRATLYQIEKDGPEGKHWGAPGGPVLTQVVGFANYVRMVDPQKGEPLLRRARALLKQYGGSSPSAPSPAPSSPAPAAPPPPAAKPSVDPSPAPTPAGGAAPAWLDQLTRLGELHAQGLLSDEEFAAAKRRLLKGD